MNFASIDIVPAFFAAALTVVAAVYLLGRVPRVVKKSENVAPEPLSLLFAEGVLHHATSRASAVFDLQPGQAIWSDLQDKMRARFPDFPDHTSSGEEGRMTIRAADGRFPEEALITWRGPLCWVDLPNDIEPAAPAIGAAGSDELAFLRRFSDTSPNPAWQEDRDSQIVWTNEAYRSLVRLVGGDAAGQQKRLFDHTNREMPARFPIAVENGGPPDWYDLSMIEVDGITTCHATCTNAVVEAEEAQRSFVQTLAKTFAQLSIGLAIFDRKGRLTIFNPALVELTGLPVANLSARPTMVSFFDQLRENRRMPEPKNYRSWRQELTDMISAAADGRYQETWTLETGQTYKVTGRPHPDGATAFLIEDKSAEVTLTRNFRAELEQAQELIDALEDAVVVFSSTGVLTFCNAAYRTLWKVEPETAFADVTIRDSMNIWRNEAVANSTSLAAIESYVVDPSARELISFEMHSRDGALLECRLSTLAHGASMLRFTVIKGSRNHHSLQLAT